MRNILFGVALLVALGGGYLYAFYEADDISSPDYVQSEAGFEEVVDVDLSSLSDDELQRLITEEYAANPVEQEDGRIRWSQYWQPFTETEAEFYTRTVRESGPIRVGVQIGHWQNDTVPEELEGLTRNGSGAQGGGTTELATVKVIAERLKVLLEAEGIEVELLPATIPIDYFADAFVSIHADGNANTSVRGFKIAGPRFDYSGRSDALVAQLYESYAEGTGLPTDSNITRRMNGYYAFNWRRYDHALHPLTPAAIVETGFMSSPADRALIVGDPDRVAGAIADGLLKFFEANPVAAES